MKQTIFYLEGRGGLHLYHFYIYNLGGLYYILNKIYNYRGNSNTSVLLDDTIKTVEFPTTDITFPIKIYIKQILPFQKEAFEIIKDKFILIEDLSKIEDYEIISIYGETAINSICDNEHIIYPFIRNLFLEKMNYDIIPKKRIFITRKNCELYHNELLKRMIINENEIIEKLKKYNFEYIQLEDYNTYEKQLLEPYNNNPIDISIGFYGLCSYQHIAWDYVFQQIRKYYPDAPIVLINDGFLKWLPSKGLLLHHFF